MTPRLQKSLKVSADTHKAIKLAAAQEGVTMAEWLAQTVQMRVRSSEPIRLNLSAEDADEFNKVLNTADETIYPLRFFIPLSGNIQEKALAVSERTPTVARLCPASLRGLRCGLLNGHNGTHAAILPDVGAVEWYDAEEGQGADND